MLLPEYGRHVQTMIEQMLDIEDRDLRNREARSVIAVMGNINPFLRDTEDYKHKLWDHMFIISNFRLDVDCPYKKITPEDLRYTPLPLSYPHHRIKHKQYGQYVKDMLKAISHAENEEEKIIVAGNLAKFMKFKSYEYNREFPSNDVIIDDIRDFTNNAIILDDDTLDNTKIAFKPVGKNKKSISKKSAGIGKHHRNNSTNKRSALKK